MELDNNIEMAPTQSHDADFSTSTTTVNIGESTIEGLLKDVVHEIVNDEEKLPDTKMETDDETEADKENIARVVRTLTRKELEELVMTKVIEAISSKSEMGKLRTKVLQLHATKDKLFQKCSSLMKQVTELTKAVKQLAENQSRNPNKPTAPMTLPIKFFRSVGLQVNTDISKPSRGPVRVIPQLVSNNTSNIQLQQPILNGGGLSAAGLKRVIRPQISVSEVTKQVPQHSYNNPRLRKSLPNSNTSIVRTPVMRNPAAQAASNALAASAAQSALNGLQNRSVVDLTDDQNIMPSTSNVFMTSNGVQYRIVNAPQLGGQSQVVSSGYQIVGQGNRPILINPSNSIGTQQIRAQSPLQTVVLRNTVQGTRVVPNSNSIAQTRIVNAAGGSARPIMALQSSPQRISQPISGALIRSPTNVIKKFQLPSLPGLTIHSNLVTPTLDPPPKPDLHLTEQPDGIVLSWGMKLATNHSAIASYQIYACQEPGDPNSSNIKPPAWKRVGDVKALPLPMACTLSQFTEANRYHFIVRAIDTFGRSGQFCEPQSILLKKKH